MDLTPGDVMTFTVKRVPDKDAARKTIRRLMRMQPEIQKGLEQLSKRRKREDINARQRAGRVFLHRPRTTKLTHVGAGESFTVRVTPQIMPDIRSVASYLDARAASEGE